MNRVQYATKIKEDLRDKLKELSDQTRIPQSKYLDEAIEDLLKKYNISIEEAKEDK
jgi:predicted DNA-binding protein